MSSRWMKRKKANRPLWTVTNVLDKSEDAAVISLGKGKIDKVIAAVITSEKASVDRLKRKEEAR